MLNLDAILHRRTPLYFRAAENCSASLSQHMEHGFNGVTGEECKRRCPERADGIGNHLRGGGVGAGEKADCYSEDRAKYEAYDVFAQVARGKETFADATQIAPQNVSQ